MSTMQLANAISMLDDNLLTDILEERYDRNAKLKRSGHRGASIRRFSLLAATVAVACSLAIILAMPHFVGQPNTNNALDAPQYIAAFSSPELDALYKEYPYSELLPQKIPETLKFTSSYKTEYDPIANPNNEQYLTLIFSAEKANTSLEVKVMSYDGNTVIADPQRPDTYDLAPYYMYIETPGAVGADAPKVTGLFRAEDVSKAIAERRMYVFADGLCKAEIEILCGDYIVAYQYVGAELSTQLFFDMITSSCYFLDTTSNSSSAYNNHTQLPGIEPAYIPAYSTPSMELLYKETPYDILLPRQILPNCKFLSSYKIEFDPVANPDNHHYLSVVYQASGPNDFLEISISDQLDNILFADLNNPLSYDLSHYYKDIESNLASTDQNQYFGVFKAEELSELLMESRIHIFEDGLCKANIDIVCDAYLISYNYTGSAITSAELYAMITSAQWFS